MLADDLQDGFRIRSGIQRPQELIPALHLRDAGERVEMLLELSLRHQQEGHQVHRLAVQGVELDSLA